MRTEISKEFQPSNSLNKQLHILPNEERVLASVSNIYTANKAV